MSKSAWYDLAKIARYAAFKSDMKFALEVMQYELEKRIQTINATKRINAKGVLAATKSAGRQVKAVAPQDLKQVLIHMANKDYLETIRLELVKQGKSDGTVPSTQVSSSLAAAPSDGNRSPGSSTVELDVSPSPPARKSVGGKSIAMLKMIMEAEYKEDSGQEGADGEEAVEDSEEEVEEVDEVDEDVDDDEEDEDAEDGEEEGHVSRPRGHI